MTDVGSPDSSCCRSDSAVTGYDDAAVHLYYACSSQFLSKAVIGDVVADVS